MRRPTVTNKNPKWPGLSPDVLAILSCPYGGSPLVQKEEGLSCCTCERPFPVVNGTVRFVDDEEYASNFGFQWSKYACTQLDNQDSQDSESTFRRKTGFTPEELSGKLVLDLGCGMRAGLDSLRVLYEPVAVQGRKPPRVLETRLEEKPCVASQVS